MSNSGFIVEVSQQLQRVIWFVLTVFLSKTSPVSISNTQNLVYGHREILTFQVKARNFVTVSEILRVKLLL